MAQYRRPRKALQEGAQSAGAALIRPALTRPSATLSRVAGEGSASLGQRLRKLPDRSSIVLAGPCRTSQTQPLKLMGAVDAEVDDVD